MSTLGKRIKKLRYERGLTQFEMAVKLDMGRANYSHIENDRVTPSTSTLQLIADLLYTTTDYLLGRTDDPKSSTPPPGYIEWVLSLNEEEYLSYFKENCTPVLLEVASQVNSVRDLVDALKYRFRKMGLDHLSKEDTYDTLQDMITFLEIARLFVSLNRVTLLDENYAANYMDDDEDEVEDDEEPDTIPLVGTICAGQGMFADQNVEEYIFYPFENKSKADFALRVEGNSMIGAGIQNGDIVFMRRAKWAEHNGQIVAVVVSDNFGDEFGTLKRMKWSEGSPMIELLPENEDFEFEKMTVLPSEIEVCGVYMGFFRPEFH